jgi:hypothetical protein
MNEFAQNSTMGRPKSDKSKDALVSLRTYGEVHAAIADYARMEHRTIAQMADLLLREAIIARRTLAGEDTSDITELP